MTQDTNKFNPSLQDSDDE